MSQQNEYPWPLGDQQDRIKWERGDFSESPMIVLVRSLMHGMTRIEEKLEEIRKELEKGNRK